MGFPEPTASFALIVFVLLPDGRVATIGGGQLRAGRLRGLSQREFADMLRRDRAWELPPDTMTSRLHPLMPRLTRDGVVQPLWATGRITQEYTGHLDRALSLRHDLGALERLADELRDPSLVEEAIADLRRALAADLVTNQVTGESVRLRALAAQESRARSDGGELPLLMSLLPRTFTIDQLREAATGAVGLASDEAETSSNFRRRVTELVEAGVLREVGEVALVEKRGRPPMLYTFDRERWSEWVFRRLREPSLREAHRLRRELRDRDLDDMMPRVLFSRRSVEGLSSPPARVARQMRPPQPSEPAAETMAPPIQTAEGPDRERLERLEKMVAALMQQLGRSGGEQAPPGAENP